MNNTIHIFVALLATTLAGIFPVMGQKVGPVTDTISMGAGYAKEIYYSMAAGNKGTIDRKQWDIAFRASRLSASILTNDGANNNPIGLSGVELYTYPKSDSSGWATVDTTGLFGWKKMVNSTTDWETGAFDQNQLGHPDYGWGKYNTATHDVIGDSLYIIKLRDGSLRKLFIKRKYSSLNMVEFRYAKIDGANDTTVTVDCNPYAAKNFVGYSITTNQVVDFEPVVSTDWDILFTRYMYTYPDGVQYPVVGVLSNYETKVNRFEHVAPDFRIFDLESMDSTRSPIGWEWKYLDANFIFHVQDSLVHFIQDRNGNIHRLVFKDFVGSSSGRIVLEKEMISATGIGETGKADFNAAIYPNPASDVMNVVINPENGSSAVISIHDMSGRTVLSRKYEVQSQTLSTLQIPVIDFPAGAYIVKMQVGDNTISRKVIIKK
jgi:hypothetical protein